MAEPRNGDIVETTYNYTERRRDVSFLGFSPIEVFELGVQTGPGVYHPGDVVNYATASGETQTTQLIGQMWEAAALATAITEAGLASGLTEDQLARRLFQLGSNHKEMLSGYTT